MRPLQTLLLPVVLALAAAACGSPTASVESTQQAMDAIIDDIEAVEGVQAVRRLGPDESTGFASATVVEGSLVLEPDVDQAGAKQIVEQAAELIWRSDAPVIDAIFVRSAGDGLEGYVTLSDVLDDTNSDGLRAHFGERP